MKAVPMPSVGATALFTRAELQAVLAACSLVKEKTIPLQRAIDELERAERTLDPRNHADGYPVSK